MGTLEHIIGGILLLMALFLIVAVLLQSGKSKNLSGTIAGGSTETYFGKNRSSDKDRKLSILTTVVSIIFTLLVIVLYIVVS